MTKTGRKRKEARARALEESDARKKKLAQNGTLRKQASKPLTTAQKLAVEAKVALDTEQKATARACLEEVLAVCKKHSCRLHARPITMPTNDGYFVLVAEPLISNLPSNLKEEAPSE